MAGNVLLRRIREVHAEPNYRLSITYADGETIAVDLSSIVRQAGVFAPLGDPDFFARVAVAPNGRALRWPRDIDLCADALWLETHPETRRDVG